MMILGEVLRAPGMPGKVFTSDAVADGVVLVERKVWTAPLGIQGQWIDGTWHDDYATRPARAPATQMHIQDTWWISTHTLDCAASGWTEYVENHVTEVAVLEIGPVEIPRRGHPSDPGRPIPRCLIDGATWDNINPRDIYPEGDRRFRPLDGPQDITMAIGFAEIDLREFLLDPWYTTALSD